jgi:signal transduction histidine kinase
MAKNALEASGPGDTVTLSCAREGGSVAFTVHNPSFMPRDVQLQIFQRSFTTKGEGRGIGTYSMKLLTERYMHGTISFQTSPDIGTTFKMTVPAETPADSVAG